MPPAFSTSCQPLLFRFTNPIFPNFDPPSSSDPLTTLHSPSPTLPRCRRVQRFPGMGTHCSKVALASSFTHAQALAPTADFDFVPRTWTLPGDEALVEQQEGWLILKPDKGTRGCGILLRQGGAAALQAWREEMVQRDENGGMQADTTLHICVYIYIYVKALVTLHMYVYLCVYYTCIDIHHTQYAITPTA